MWVFAVWVMWTALRWRLQLTEPATKDAWQLWRCIWRSQLKNTTYKDQTNPSCRQFEKVAGVSWLHYVALLLNLNTILHNLVHLAHLENKISQQANYLKGSNFCWLSCWPWLQAAKIAKAPLRRQWTLFQWVDLMAVVGAGILVLLGRPVFPWVLYLDYGWLWPD